MLSPMETWSCLYCAFLWLISVQEIFSKPCASGSHSCNNNETCYSTDNSSYTCLSTTCQHADGFGYIGEMSVTIWGTMCQRWDSQTPHSHNNPLSGFPLATSLSDVQNYCRNPDGSAAAWCYTLSVNTRWDYCPIPSCSDPCATVPHTCTIHETCYNAYHTRYTCLSAYCQHGNGFNYIGEVSVTISGRTCQRWDSQYPHDHAQPITGFPLATSLADAHNYCRNPDGENHAWCYTTDPDERWEFCDIPPCPVAAGANNVEYTNNVANTWSQVFLIITLT